MLGSRRVFCPSPYTTETIVPKDNLKKILCCALRWLKVWKIRKMNKALRIISLNGRSQSCHVSSGVCRALKSGVQLCRGVWWGHTVCNRGPLFSEILENNPGINQLLSWASLWKALAFLFEVFMWSIQHRVIWGSGCIRGLSRSLLALRSYYYWIFIEHQNWLCSFQRPELHSLPVQCYHSQN